MQTALLQGRLAQPAGCIKRLSTHAPVICKPCLPGRVFYVHAKARETRVTRKTEGTTTTSRVPAPGLQQKLSSLLQNAAKAAAVLGVAVALVLGRCDAAQAARSAGRAGGFSAPSAGRSYGGGGYSGGGSRGYSGGYSGGGVYSSPYSYRAPFVIPSPPILVPSPMMPMPGGVMVAPRPAIVSTGPDIVDIAIVSVFLIAVAGLASSMLRSGVEGFGGDDTGFSRPTLTRVQVGLVSLARELKHDLDRIAARADTGTSRGLHQLLQEVALALLRNPKYCIYGASSQKACSNTSSLESAFNSASLKERSKFEQETLVNVGGSSARRSTYRPSSSSSSSSSSKPDELVVVTLLVATGCKVDVPEKINSLADLKEALQALGGLPQDQVLGVELMWTPQAEGDYYTREEIVQDYPHLRQL